MSSVDSFDVSKLSSSIAASAVLTSTAVQADGVATTTLHLYGL